ncbi:unnamed protein product, partial [Ixodes persulcatus]
MSNTRPYQYRRLRSKTLSAVQLDISPYNTPQTEHICLLTQLPHSSTPILILNTYWTPSVKPSLKWLTAFLQQHPCSPVVWAGDFNTPHPDSLYTYTTHSGRRLRTLWAPWR